jgi:hypothetical protein
MQKSGWLSLFLCVLLILVAGCTSGSSKPTTTPAPPESFVTLGDQYPGHESYGDFYVSGLVTSNSSESLTAWVGVVYYNNDGVRLGDGYDIVKLDPYGTSHFHATVFNSNTFPQGKYTTQITRVY